MVNLELYHIACSCANKSGGYIDVVFDGNDVLLEKYDVLEYRPSGFFVKSVAKKEKLWPISESDMFGEDSLYIVEDFDKRNVQAKLIKWSFGGKTIKGIEEKFQDVVVPDSIMEHLPKKLPRGDIGSLIEWLNVEFFFPVDNGESMFFRIVGGGNGMDGGWLGRNYIADVVEKRVGQKDYLIIEKLRKSPQKALNIQRGCAKVRFVNEREAESMDPIFKAQLALSSSDPNSVINLWKKYNEMDEKIFLSRQELAGTLRVERLSIKERKIYATIQNSPESIENFKGVYEALNGDYSISVSSPAIKGDFPVKSVLFDSAKQIVSWEWDGKLPHEKLIDPELKIDFKPWVIQSKRRKEALELIRSRNIPIPAIVDLLNKTIVPTFDSFHPGRIPNERILCEAFGNSKANDAQLRALKICLGTPDIALVQGPPGTGKTSVIRALQNVLHRVDPKHSMAVPSILLTSFQHVAVDNVAAKSKIWGLPVFRFYGAKKDKELVFEGLRNWQSETAEFVDQRIKALHIDAEYAKYEKLWQALRYIGMAEFSYEVCSLLSETVDLAKNENILVQSEINDLLEWKRKFQNNRKSIPLYSLLMGIRTSSIGFQDDGKANIGRLLRYYDSRKQEIVCPALENGYDRLKKYILSEPDETGYVWLHELRNECVNQINPDRIGSRDNSLFRMLKNYINKTLLPNIEKRIKHTDIHLMQVLMEYRESVKFKSIRNAMLKYAVTFAATTQQSKSEAFVKMLGDRNFGFDYVIVDEAARANPLDLFIPMTLARKKVILVGDHRQLPQLVEQGILEQMEEEPDKLSQLKQNMEESLFETLWNYLKNERNDGIERTVTLNIQYRMPKKLGDFISANFYDSDAKILTMKNPEDCKHFVSRYRKSNGECMCAAWEDVDGVESGRRSKKNEEEAIRIMKRLEEIVKETDETIGVVASYSEQVKFIEQMVKMNSALNEAVTRQQLEIGTIDAFQGKQFDIVFFSVVRNNKHSEFGFLAMANRLNVAFSRQKKLLVVVGNRRMFSSDKAKEKVPALNAFINLANSEMA